MIVGRVSMALVERIKRWLALVILVCFFLPLAQCSSMESPGTGQAEGSPPPKVLVPADGLKFESRDEMQLVGMYVWPLLFVGIRRMANARWSMALVGVAEAIIGGGVLWGVVVTIGVWGTVRYGGVILVSAHVAYLVAVMITLYGCVRAPSGRPLRAQQP